MGVVMSELLNLGRAARRLGVSSRWLKCEAESGRVPCLPAGNKFLFNIAALIDELAERAAKTPQRTEPTSCV